MVDGICVAFGRRHFSKRIQRHAALLTVSALTGLKALKILLLRTRIKQKTAFRRFGKLFDLLGKPLDVPVFIELGFF